MSTRDSAGDAVRTGSEPAPAAAPELPVLSEQRIDEVEEVLFAGIAHERRLESDRLRRAVDARRRTRRGWLIGAGAAAVVVTLVAIAPSLARIGTIGAASGDDESAVAPDAPPGAFPDRQSAFPDKNTDLGGAPAMGSAISGGSGDNASTAGRDIIATASATVRVDDVAAAARAARDAAQRRGGYVESMNVGSEGRAADVGGFVDGVVSYPVDPNGGWITVRVPADQLTAAIEELSPVGEVEASSITRQDVTTQAVDLRARVDALQASVDRLTELMAKSGSVADLIAAESALSQRQADLESYQQQRKSLEDQVAMSSLTVTIVPRVTAVTADPAGFGDGLANGWNGMVATLNGLVIAIGFLLPWLAVAAVAALIVWLILRMVRRRRRAPEAPAQE